MTKQTAIEWAGELGIKVPNFPENAEVWGCWIDRVHQAGLTGKQEHIDEANHYSGRGA